MTTSTLIDVKDFGWGSSFNSDFYVCPVTGTLDSFHINISLVVFAHDNFTSFVGCVSYKTGSISPSILSIV